MARKDRALAELKSEQAQMELDSASRRGIISEMREKNRSLEKAVARYKADVDMLAAELSRAHHVNTSMHRAAEVDAEEGGREAGPSGSESQWWNIGAEWGLAQRVMVGRAVEQHDTTWRTAGCALAQLLLDPNLRAATEAAFVTMAAAVASGVPKGEEGEDSEATTLALGALAGVCNACSGTGVATTLLATLQHALSVAEARVAEVTSAGRGSKRPVIIQLVSQSLIPPEAVLGTSTAVVPKQSRKGTVDDDDDTTERNESWRRRRSDSYRFSPNRSDDGRTEALVEQVTQAHEDISALQVRPSQALGV